MKRKYGGGHYRRGRSFVGRRPVVPRVVDASRVRGARFGATRGMQNVFDEGVDMTEPEWRMLGFESAEAHETWFAEAMLNADMAEFDLGLVSAAEVGLVPLASAMLPLAAAVVAVEVATIAWNWFFGVSSNNLMSGACYTKSVHIGTKKPWPKDVGAKLRLDHNWNKYTLCGPGLTHHATFFIGDATNNYTGVPTTGLLPGINFFDMNPNESITGSTTYTTVANPNADKLFSANSKGFIDFTNNSNIGVFFQLTWYRCKNQTSQGPIVNHQEYLQGENLGITTIAPPSGSGSTGSSGYYDATISSYDETANSYVGFNPNAIPASQKVWELESRSGGFLPASTNLRYNFVVDFHHTRSKREMNNSLLYQKGTIVGIISYHGEAVTQSDSTMVHSPCSVGWVGHQRLTLATVAFNERIEPILSHIRDATNGTVFKAWTGDASASVANVP